MEGIKKSLLEAFIDAALREDVKDGDHTSLACIDKDSRDRARLIVKDTGVIAGISFAEYVFKRLDGSSDFIRLMEDGQDVSPGDVAFEIECGTHAFLKAERLVLNTMQRLSGVSSMSRKYAKLVEDLPVTILDTRKTTPLMRFLEKWAVRVGGCSNYRDGLYDWIMIKDNHVEASGGVTAAIQKVKSYLEATSKNLDVTVEVRDMRELEEAMHEGGIRRIMLDNFEVPELKEAVSLINGRFESEASGGISYENLRAYAETGVDFISVGALTHSAGSLDMSLKIQKHKN